MKVVADTRSPAGRGELDMNTIRRRVARIKSQWSPEVARARAAEGARRRRELDALVDHLLVQAGDESFRESGSGELPHGLSLVG